MTLPTNEATLRAVALLSCSAGEMIHSPQQGMGVQSVVTVVVDVVLLVVLDTRNY